ncbi:MAG TPA: hypothetical protein PKO15_18940 [Fibrobacteria bacterium]|nr:hypothetical protein [Fibrobacteria bacterium]
MSRVELSLLVLLGASVGWAGPVQAPRAQVLVPDASVTARRLVASLPPLGRPGERPDFQWFRSASDPKDLAWLVDADGLLVVRVRKVGESLQMVRYWDFAAVAPSEPLDGTTRRAVHPVLYPAGRDRWAMAVLTHHSASYSGGSAAWTWATFHELMDLGAPTGVPEGGLELLHREIPFHCEKSIRACFDEGGVCQETWSGILRLRYGKPDPFGTYPWSAAWEETHSPGKRSARREVERFAIDLDDPPASQCTEPMD